MCKPSNMGLFLKLIEFARCLPVTQNTVHTSKRDTEKELIYSDFVTIIDL